MPTTAADDRELLLPLYEGVRETPPWGRFLRNLVARTGAARGLLLLRPVREATGDAAAVTQAGRRRADPPLDPAAIEAIRPRLWDLLRPGRVYALEELLDHDRPERLAHQRAALGAMGLSHARCLRVLASGVGEVALLLARERDDFSGADAATLGRVAPHLAAALGLLGDLAAARLRLRLGEATLARLGVGQLALDAAGRVIAADPLAEAQLSFVTEPGSPPARRLDLLPEAARALEAASAALMAAPPGLTRLVRLGSAGDLLLRRAELERQLPLSAPAIVATLRTGTREDRREAIRLLSAQHGLSASEAALAHALSTGETILAAGRRLHLTPETARNYSKRIYAKTGARGQADLVRLILTGLAPLA